jgi:inorganic pyrophosphatase/exopolyphosphatase
MSSLSIPDFVKGVKQRVITEKQQEQLPHIVIGNAAGDADSIIGAITLAYVKTLQQQGQQLIVPIVSILADDLKFLRPETTFLLKDCAGMDNIKDDVNDLIAIDQIDELLPSKATVTLVDHNYNQRQEQSQWTVTEIVDHHLDEGKHMDTSPPQQRNIAFENSKALVASCATLVAEQFYNNNNDDGTTKTKMHPTLAGTYDVNNTCAAAAVAVITVSVVVTTSIVVVYHKQNFTLSLSLSLSLSL